MKTAAYVLRVVVKNDSCRRYKRYFVSNKGVAAGKWGNTIHSDAFMPYNALSVDCCCGMQKYNTLALTDG